MIFYLNAASYVLNPDKATHFRYRREEAKIQAWENHRKAKYETKLRRIEVSLSC